MDNFLSVLNIFQPAIMLWSAFVIKNLPDFMSSSNSKSKMPHLNYFLYLYEVLLLYFLFSFKVYSYTLIGTETAFKVRP